MDDSFLNTGQNSASMTSVLTRKLAKQRQEDAEKAAKERQKLSPVGKDLVELCDKELASIYDMRSLLINPATSDEAVKVERQARVLHEKFVHDFKVKVQQILKEKGVK